MPVHALRIIDAACIAKKIYCMKKITTTYAIIAFLLIACSFKTKPEISTALPKQSNFTVRIDGYPFDAKIGDNSLATLVDNRLESRGTTATITLVGNDVKDKEGNYNAQKLEIEYVFRDGALGFVTAKKIMFEFNTQKFYNVAGSARLNITKAEFSADKKTVLLSANFTCKVKKSSLTEDVLPVLGISGKIEDMIVDVPKSVTEEMLKTIASAN